MMGPRLCIFDMEGTLFQLGQPLSDGRIARSAWTLLAARLGPMALEEDQANKRRWKQGEIKGYSQWVGETIALHRRHGLTRPVFDEVVRSVAYFPGVGDTLGALKGASVEIAVVSGGLKAMADRVSVDHEIHHCFAAAEYFWAEDGKIRHWNVMPTDYTNKRKVVELLCEDLGVRPEECAFVGDGKNDTTVARFVGTSVAFNPHAELRDCATHVVEQAAGAEDLSAVLPYLLG